ncbi:MAG: outer membrane protein transport protein, partial [Nitrospirota bacterium]|nr:outer membrane protein transport protein [Nitrospirota bacterium]
MTSLGLALGAGPASAGGLYLQEFGTPGMGAAEAGAQALASDASTAWHNPASMSRLEQSQFMTGGAVLHSNIRFDADPDTPIAGNDGGQIGGTNPILSLHAVHKFGEGVSGGFSLVSISGAGLDYNDEWAGRFQNTSVDLLTLSFVPSLAYQVTDTISVGAGLNILYGNFDAQVAVPPPDGTGRVKIDDADGADAGVIVSTLLEPAEGTRFGLVYQSKIQPTLKGQIDVNPVDADANIDIKIPLAETVRLGAYQEISDQWALLGSLRWENWSQFGDIPVSVERGSTSVPTGWRDTYGFSVGMHFRPTESWLLQAGF